MPAADIKKNTAGEPLAAVRTLCKASVSFSLNVTIVSSQRDNIADMQKRKV